MIFIRDKIYAKVWKVDVQEKYIDLQVTTSEKDRDGNYVNSGWFPRLIGHAFNSLKGTIKEGDYLIITKSKITNERYKDKEGKDKSRFKFVVLEASIDTSKTTTEQNTSVAAEATPVKAEKTDNQGSCPW